MFMTTNESGLQWEDIKVGEGSEAQSGNTVTVHYSGTLMDGTPFDSSRSRGPFQFRIDGGMVIKGWDEGVAGMKIGGTRVLVIPPNLAYGDAGAGGIIPGGATLKFEVELLGVN
ncbi:MAG: peptidylprolyl isomerase [Candidatus Kerfeldbacteria bacterium CG_4_9_14_3_um_filter_45_8]|nr:MAG: peptidylprolyl isomerase [Candidatus Kerfeldbacteria bacterium CG_4_9_14_3_um_filter_45_8]